jgi:uncharacterized protein (DUF983 family)
MNWFTGDKNEAPAPQARRLRRIRWAAAAAIMFAFVSIGVIGGLTGAFDRYPVLFLLFGAIFSPAILSIGVWKGRSNVPCPRCAWNIYLVKNTVFPRMAMLIPSTCPSCGLDLEHNDSKKSPHGEPYSGPYVVPVDRQETSWFTSNVSDEAPAPHARKLRRRKMLVLAGLALVFIPAALMLEHSSSTFLLLTGVYVTAGLSTFLWKNNIPCPQCGWNINLQKSSLGPALFIPSTCPNCRLDLENPHAINLPPGLEMAAIPSHIGCRA